MKKTLATLFAAVVLMSGCDSNLEEPAVVSPGGSSFQSPFAGHFTGRDLEEPGSLDLTVDSSGQMRGFYVAEPASGIFAPGTYPLVGQVDHASGYYRLTSPSLPDLVLQGRLPLAERRPHSFTVHKTGDSSAGMLVRGTSNLGFYVGTISNFTIVENGSNVGDMSNLRVQGVLEQGQSGNVQDVFTVQLTAEEGSTKRILVFQINSDQNGLAATNYPLIPQETDDAAGFFSWMENGNESHWRVFESDNKSPGTFNLSLVDATHIVGTFVLNRMFGVAASGASGSFGCSGTVDMTFQP